MNEGVVSNSVISNNSANAGGGAHGATLSNCTITNNSAQSYGGGGVSGCTLFNCSLVGNMANSSSNDEGGGADSSTYYNCVLSGNTAASGQGGGCSLGVLYNCTIVSNSCPKGGGAAVATLYNSIVINNSSPGTTNSNNFHSTFFYCDTTRLPSGNGNITNSPAFVNSVDGDYHLQSNSPCINSGDNAYVSVTNDLDGNTRIKGGTVDIGAYEYQTPNSVLSYAWAQQYGLPTDGSVDYANLDGTGFNVYQDWIADLNPTNPASVLSLQAPAATNNSAGITVTWQSVSTRTYFLQRSSDLTQPFSAIQSNIVGQAGTTSYSDTTATNTVPYFYRVGVQSQ